MPRKKTSPSPSKTQPNKSAFVRGLPFDMPSADVIAKAKAQGITLQRTDVHAIRAIARRRGDKPAVNKAASASPALAPSTSTGRMNKSAFVRSLPGTMSAADVIAEGKALGMKLSAAQVYVVRANARKMGMTIAKAKPVAGEAAAPRAAATVKAAAPRAVAAAPMRGDAESKFVALVLDLGLTQSKALIERVRAAIGA